MKKTFRGQLAEDDVEKIRLSTNNGLTGYRIVKFELLPADPTANNEAVVQIFTTEDDATSQPRTAGTSIDFRDPTLVAAGLWSNNSITHTYSDDLVVVFDNSIFNQDIYITYKSSSGQLPINYLLELEQVKLSQDEATMATLKDMRGGPSSF